MLRELLLFHGFDRRAWGDAPYPSVVGTLATPGGKKASGPEDDENPKEWQKRIVVYGKCLALQWPTSLTVSKTSEMDCRVDYSGSGSGTHRQQWAKPRLGNFIVTVGSAESREGSRERMVCVRLRRKPISLYGYLA